MIDLHVHSSASDGSLSPARLVTYASEKKVSVLALTDHDCVDGITEAQSRASELGIVFVPGIELSVQWPSGEFHLLGLGLRRLSPELDAAIRFLKDERKRRNEAMVERLRSQGIDITYDEVAAKAGGDAVGRPHFAQVLVEKRVIRKPRQAFDLYLGKGRPCYVERTGLELEDAVRAIKTSGGIPVQAHPLSIYVSWGKMEETLAQIRGRGVEGLEAWHPGARKSEAARFEALAKKLGMIATGGSDFHGEKIRADRKIGFSSGGRPIDEKFWSEELEPALMKIHLDGSHSFGHL